MKYRSEIDGLRAVAVIPVILFHAGFSTFSGGFVGVDIFFVISGYLITSIIITELNEERFSLVTFYERRARRILPALFMVIAASIPFAWLWLPPTQMKEFGQSIVATSLFSSNVLFWIQTNYFDVGAELKPLLHTWSLAVEEQYYILFPLFLIVAWWTGRQVVFPVLALAFVASLGLTHWDGFEKPTTTFYLLPTRGWELLIGSFCAFATTHNPENKTTNNILSLLGISLIAYAVFYFDSDTPFPSLYTLIPTAGTALIILFARERSFVHSFLSLRPLVAIGLISYSAYLWHQPLFAYYRHYALDEPAATVLLLLCLTSIGVAYVSWRFIEQPFRNKRVFGRRFIFTMSPLVIGVMLATGLYIHVNKGLADRQTLLNIKSYNPDNKALQGQSWALLRERSGSRTYGVHDNPFDNQLWFDLNDDRSRLLVVGNSHSKDMYNVLMHSPTVTARAQIARYGTQLEKLEDKDHAFYQSPNYQNADRVIIATRYQREDVESLNTIIPHLKEDGKDVLLTGNIFEFEEYANKNLTDILFIRSQRADSRPERPRDLSRYINHEHYVRYQAGEGRRDNLETLNESIERIAENFSVPFKDRMQYVCSDGAEVCYTIDDDYTKFFYDYGHHTLAGAKFFGSRIAEIGWADDLL